ncbi:MAG: sigma-70 family RNA polymerase sigma factor [Actinomycetota bacterium]
MTRLATDDLDLDERLEAHRKELTGYCYRMLGSPFDAQDAVQDTFVRAWKNFDRFEGRSTMRSWLYSIATNVCLDMLNGRKRRAMPVDLTVPSRGDGPPGAIRPENTWIRPIPDATVAAPETDPAEVAVARETIRVAFVTALQHLPTRQRAVLILRDVLRWRATEVAELLETTVVSVNSALQRARSTISAADLTASEAIEPTDDAQRALLTRYVDAFERFDIDSLISLLHEDATLTMPPYEMWMHGRDAFDRWLRGGGAGCRGSRLMPTIANGAPAFGQWRPDPDGGYSPWAIHVLELSAGAISGIHFFVDPELFALFGLPDRLED